MPQISVIVPTRNRVSELRRAVDSVLAQEGVDLEIIVVDDGSFPAIQRSCLPDSDAIILVRNARTLGAQHSRMIGLERARGKYAAFLDSDDWWRSTKLSRQLYLSYVQPDTLIACRVVAVRGAMAKTAPRRTIQAGERVESFLYVFEGMLQTSTVFAKRELLIYLLRESVNSIVHNDTRIFIAAQKVGVRIVQLDDALSYFDDSPRRDRISYDVKRLGAAEEWFREEAGDWDERSRKGFILTDLVTRNVNAGRRLKAMAWLLKSWHPNIPKTRYLKKALYILCGGSPRRLLEYFTGRIACGLI